MSKGSGGTTTVQSADPWTGQQPFLNLGFQVAQQNLAQPQQFYPGRTYTPFSAQTEQGIGRIGALSADNPVTTGLRSYVERNLAGAPSSAAATDLVRQGVSNPYQLNPFQAQNFMRGNVREVNPTANAAIHGSSSYAPDLSGLGYTSGLPGAATGALTGIASGQTPIPGMNRLGQNVQLDPTGLQQLTGTASGAQGNPFLDDMFRAATQNVTERFGEATVPAINAAFGRGGRTGGGLHGQTMSGAAGELGDVLGNVGAQLYGSNAQLERDRQLQAARDITGLGLQRQAQDTQRAGLQGNLGLAGTAQQAQAAQALGGLSLADEAQRVQAAQAAQQLGLQGAQQRTGAGAALGQLGLGVRGQDINVAQRALAEGAQNQDRQLQGANILAGLYGQDIGNQFRVGALAPAASDLAYGDITKLLGAGQLVEGKAQEVIGDAKSRFDFGQQERAKALSEYIAAIQGNYGGVRSIEEERETNPLAGVAGGALAGSQIAGQTGGLWPAILGGLLGGAATI